MKFLQYTSVPYMLHRCEAASVGYAHRTTQAGGDDGVGDAGGIEPVCTDAPDGARPRGERKDALDTVA